VKTETIQIAAKDVQIGDVIDGRKVHVTGYHPPMMRIYCIIPTHETSLCIDCPADAMLTISRPVADPCPRGRMSLDSDGYIRIDGEQVVKTRRECVPIIWKRCVALWNEAESAEPYRTTEEIERS
jgi:hypothetical protein